MDWLSKIAPMVGTALAGPLGGAAASFIAKKLGLEDETVEAVTEVLNSGKMTPEQISALKLAEVDFRKFLEANKIKLEEIHAGDRKDARALLATVRSKMPAVLSVIVTLGYFGILTSMMLGYLKVDDSQALLLMLGSLSTAWGMVMAFWFGTTDSSGQKNALLAQSQPAK